MSAIVNDNTNDWFVGTDETVNSWLLMRSPIPLFSILSIWLAFVLKIGPSVMANKKPFNLKEILIGYNAFQVAFSAYIFVKTIYVTPLYEHLMTSQCSTQRSRVDELNLYTAAWFFFFSKIIDLLDTIFFVMRKKQNQITFLHVYHHLVTAVFTWGYLKYSPGEEGVIVGLLNSFVHIVMYFYYMVSAMGPKYQKYIWWKKHMTKIQMIQFILILSYMASLSLKSCEVSKGLIVFIAVNCSIFLYLFFDFYRSAYNKQKKLAEGAALNGSSTPKSNGVAKAELDLNNNVPDAKKIDYNNNVPDAKKVE